MITTARFYRAGHVSWSLSWPFLASSAPLAFVGGALTLPGTVYRVLVGAVLLFAAYRMFWFTEHERSTAAPRLLAALAWGAVLGFISGLTGLGGGIFLSPLLLFMGWANFPETAGASSTQDSLGTCPACRRCHLRLFCWLWRRSLAAEIGVVVWRR